MLKLGVIAGGWKTGGYHEKAGKTAENVVEHSSLYLANV